MGFQNARQAFSSVLGHGAKLPSEHEARWMTDQMRYSPDYGYLEQFEYQLLFCADDTKENHSHHCLIEDSRFLSNGFTVNSFNYWLQETVDASGSIVQTPIPMLSDKPQILRYTPPPLKVAGQIFAVRPYKLIGLDNYKRNTVQFRRKRVNIIVPYRIGEYKTNDELEPHLKLPQVLQGARHHLLSEERNAILRCWMYVGHPDYWDGLFDAGFRGFKTVNIFQSKRPWLKEYYAYPKRPLESG
jgi:hypothetical protein